ncbi:Integrin-linked protein kinase like protein [Argiope bruennichi]|uniref:Integrin-linked protein kinase like protein n=1 Tax=Argiope bruennichi TaxID=94029 RepID=A0A8T0E908_ARGBR|nr:Integrin-linked protein kinase like protein [Argiope bruennichi]
MDSSPVTFASVKSWRYWITMMPQLKANGLFDMQPGRKGDAEYTPYRHPLHWASKEGRANIVEMLIARGCRINATNLGDDTALHLASAHGHRDIVHMIVQGCNAKKLLDLAVQLGQDTTKIAYKDQSWLGTKPVSRDATLSRHSGINLKEISFQVKLAVTPSGETWRGRWQKNDVVAKILKVREVIPRVTRDFNEEYPRLRIFSHPNVLPVIGCCCHPPSLVVINQYMPFGSLYTVLHEGTGIVVDTAQALKFAIDICRGMAFLHTLDPLIPRLYLSSKHVMIDDDLTARVNMADAKFSFQEKGKMYSPAWISPEALQKKPEEINVKAADMWSYAILLWELATREVPFSDLSAMECGMKIALEGLRITIPPGISQHMSRLIRICMNEDPGKRPTFDMILPILEKMKQ